MEVYITDFNAIKIIKKIDLKNTEIVGDLYKESNRLLNAMFSKYERHELLAFKELMENPIDFMNEIYNMIPQRKDTYWWVYEENNPPSYHSDPTCPYLKSNFKNYKIPASIRFKGVSKDKNIETISLKNLNETEQKIVESNAKEYRDWWKENEYLFSKDKAAFLMRVNLRFKPEPRIRDITEFEAKNSGIEKLNDCTLCEIEAKIDQLIKESGAYYSESTKNRTILYNHSKSTNYLYNNRPFPSKNIGYTNEEIMEVLKEYDERFKMPLKIYLREYYRIKNNPNLKMERDLLEQLGFKPCGHCGGHPSSDEAFMLQLETDEYNDMMYYSDLERHEKIWNEIFEGSSN